MSRRKWWVVGVTVVAGLVVCAGMVPHLRTVSTHHSQIAVVLAEHEHDKQRKLSEYEQVVTIVEAWAGPAGSSRVPPADTGSMRQSSVSTAGDQDGRMTYFRERTPRDKAFPTEVMIVCYAEGSARILVSTAEGYHRHPSKQLRGIHETLSKLLEARYPGKVQASIW